MGRLGELLGLQDGLTFHCFLGIGESVVSIQCHDCKEREGCFNLVVLLIYQNSFLSVWFITWMQFAASLALRSVDHPMFTFGASAVVASQADKHGAGTAAIPLIDTPK